MILEALRRYKDRNGHQHFLTEKIGSWCRAYLEALPPRRFRALDVGLGTARDLLAVREACKGLELELYGLESLEHHIQHAREVGITTHAVDLERDRLPFDDAFFDIVLSSHVIEHTKELFWIFSEISRVLKPGGLCIIGCPNLGGWHNRAALLMGREPPAAKVLSSHVRGITRPGFVEFVEHGGFFRVESYHGANFYPFSGSLNKAFCRILPGLAASHYFVLKRTDKPGLFIETLDSAPGLTDTPYHRGG